jgi:hypothetical protein
MRARYLRFQRAALIWGAGLNGIPTKKCWECPCHGSRFDYQGRLIDDPAQNDLEGADYAQFFTAAVNDASYFEGWYFKQQSGAQTVAFIPAFHIDSSGRASASVQVITREAAYHVHFPENDFEADEKRLRIKIGSSVFSEKRLQAECRHGIPFA